MQVGKNARPDVAAAAASDLYLWSGFHAVFNVPGMPEGRYQIRLLIHTGDRTFTDGKVYKGTWRRAGRDTQGSSTGRARKEQLNVAFLGGITKAKGSELLSQVISSPDRRYNFYVLGEVGDSSVRAPKDADNVYFSGVYRKDDVFDLLKISRIDVVCILSVWAETFCYTLSEAWSCGIPVIGIDLGAVGERIRRTGAGWTLPAGASKEDLMHLLDRIASDPKELKDKKDAAAALHLKSVDEMNEEYRCLYRELMSAVAHGNAAPSQEGLFADRHCLQDNDFLFQGLAMGNPSVTGRGSAASLNRVREENDMLRASMEMLKNTTSYRIARKISEADIPFKEPLKRILRRK
jgi:glycosyltransferase involved in cell wall biosynthesis